MWIAITSLITVAALCGFIIVSIYLGTVTAIVMVAAVCCAVILGSIGLLLGIGAVILERIQHRRELSHGG